MPEQISNGLFRCVNRLIVQYIQDVLANIAEGSPAGIVEQHNQLFVFRKTADERIEPIDTSTMLNQQQAVFHLANFGFAYAPAIGIAGPETA